MANKPFRIANHGLLWLSSLSRDHLIVAF